MSLIGAAWSILLFMGSGRLTVSYQYAYLWHCPAATLQKWNNLCCDGRFWNHGLQALPSPRGTGSSLLLWNESSQSHAFQCYQEAHLSVFSALLNASRAAGTIPTIFLTIYPKKNKYPAMLHWGCHVVQNFDSFLYTLPYLKHVWGGLSHLFSFLSIYRFCHSCISASAKHNAWMCPYCRAYLPSEAIPATDVAKKMESTYRNCTECETQVCSLEH